MTYAILARNVYWPGMAHDIRRFTRNCDKCRANVVWRDRRQGLLKPLPIPERKWREISIDFIEKLPISTGCSDMMVIVDRLGKGVIIEPWSNLGQRTPLTWRTLRNTLPSRLWNKAWLNFPLSFPFSFPFLSFSFPSFFSFYIFNSELATGKVEAVV